MSFSPSYFDKAPNLCRYCWCRGLRALGLKGSTIPYPSFLLSKEEEDDRKNLSATSAAKTFKGKRTCDSCLGLFQLLEPDTVNDQSTTASSLPRVGSLPYDIVKTVRCSPYTDSSLVTLNVSIPRMISCTWLYSVNALRTWILSAPSGEDLHLPTTSSLDAAAGKSGDEQTQSSLSFDEIRRIGEKCTVLGSGFNTFKEFYSPEVKAAVGSILNDDPSTWPSTTETGVGQRSSFAKFGLPTNRKPIEQQLQLAAAPTGAALGITCDVTVLHPQDATIIKNLPSELQSTRSDAPFALSLANPGTPLSNALLKHCYLAPEDPTSLEPLTVELSLSHAPVLLCGRYRKMLRSISQSPWFTDGQRIGSFSLQEVIGNEVLDHFYPSGLPHGVVPPSNPNQKRMKRGRGDEDDNGEGKGDEIKSSGEEKKGENPLNSSSNTKSMRDLAPSLTLISDQTMTEEEVTSRLIANSVGPSQYGGMASPYKSEDPALLAHKHVKGHGLYKFHASGREDVDVRMLGDGRPFVLELMAPHLETVPQATLNDIVARVNESAGVEIEDLGYAPADAIMQLSKQSDSKKKTYTLVAWCSRPLKANDELLTRLNATKDLVVQQKTPLRVLHRRSLLARDRTIHSVQATRINDHWLVVKLETQAGTYVKEFVHGDLGRTVPNLGTLLNATTDIIQLDVTEIVFEKDNEDFTRK